VESTAMDTNLPAGVPRTQSCMWSEIACAADRADESLRAAMIAAPRFWTQGMNSLVYQASSLITSLAAWPASHRHSPVSIRLLL
jgi:hypothetical protein